MRVPFLQRDKETLLEAFGYCCGLCGDTEGVSIHHINNKTPYSNCILNGIPLCTGKFNCHKNIHTLETQSKLIKITYRKLKGYEFTDKDMQFYNENI